MSAQAHNDHGDLERALLGAVLVTPELLGAAADVVTPGDFGKRAHRAIWEALLRLDEDDKPLDLVTLKHELAELGQLEAAGGGAYLGAVVDGVPRVGEQAVVAWGRKLREAARRRQLSSALADVVRQAESGEVTAAELEASIEHVLCDVSPTAAVLDRGAVAASTWAAVEGEIRGDCQGIASGLPDLDRRLRFGGWRPGQLGYIGARTSRGKTSMVVGFAEAAAAVGRRVLFFPLEQTPEEINAKRLVAHAGVSLAFLHSWREQERDRVLAELGRAREILERPLDFASTGTRTIGQIRAACRRQQQRHGLDLVCVDYLGLVGYDRPGKLSLYERTTLVSQNLKGLAMDLGVAVLCAVQLNREPASQHGRAAKPSLAHFRDSGAIEQDCDIALLIHQGETSDAIRDGDCEMVVAKQRNGWTGGVPLVWRAACARFESAPEESRS